MHLNSVLMSLRTKWIKLFYKLWIEYTLSKIDGADNAWRGQDRWWIWGCSEENWTRSSACTPFSPPGVHHGCQAGLAAAAVQSGIPDTLRWRLWWICLLLALWPPSDPSYWETSVSDPDQTHPLARTHTASNTHFLRSLLPAASLISIGLALLV